MRQSSSRLPDPEGKDSSKKKTASWRAITITDRSVKLSPTKILVNPLPEVRTSGFHLPDSTSRESGSAFRGSSKRRKELSVVGFCSVLNPRRGSLSTPDPAASKRMKRSASPSSRHGSVSSEHDSFVELVGTNSERHRPAIATVRRLEPLSRDTTTFTTSAPLQIEGKGQQALLFARFGSPLGSPMYFGSPPKEPGQLFNLKALPHHVKAPGTPDSGTSSLDVPTSFTFRAKPRLKDSSPRPSSSSTEQYTFRDLNATIPPVSFPRKRGASCNVNRMMRSSFSSLDGLPLMLHDLDFAGTNDDDDDDDDDVEEDNDDDDGDYHMIPPMPDQTIDDMKHEQLRPVSHESHTRSDLGSSTYGSTRGSRPSSADIEAVEADIDFHMDE